jgi:hypothetical protein
MSAGMGKIEGIKEIELNPYPSHPASDVALRFTLRLLRSE